MGFEKTAQDDSANIGKQRKPFSLFWFEISNKFESIYLMDA